MTDDSADSGARSPTSRVQWKYVAAALGLLCAVLLGLTIATIAYSGGLASQRQSAPPNAEPSQPATEQAGAADSPEPGNENNAAVLADAKSLAECVKEVGGWVSRIEAAKAGLSAAATGNKSALAQWDADWERRQTAYEQRLAEVKAHNAQEKQKYDNSWVERDNPDGTWSMVPQYKPDYWANPSPPSPPPPVKVTLTKYTSELRTATGSLDQIRARESAATSVATTAATAREVVLRAVSEAHQASSRLLSAAESSVSRSDKGDVMEASAIVAVEVAPATTGLERARSELRAVAESFGMTLGDIGL